MSDHVYHGDMDESQCQDSEVLLRFHHREGRQSIIKSRVDMYIQKTSVAEMEQALVTLRDRKANLGERLSINKMATGSVENGEGSFDIRE